MMDKFAKSIIDDSPVVEKNTYFDFIPKGLEEMYKVAYVVSIPNPTIENIQNYMKEKVATDLGTRDVLVNIRANRLEGENLIDGQGLAQVKIANETVHIPFNVKDGEIQEPTKMETTAGEVVYNRSSITKLAQVSKAIEPGSPEESYVGMDKAYNESTDRGFLEEVLAVRDAQLRKGGNTTAGGRYITASITEACNDMMEKIANIQAIPDSVYEHVERSLNVKLDNIYREQFEKVATDVDKKYSHAEELFEKMKQLPLKSVSSMKHGQKIMFPARHENEMTMKTGVVFKDVSKLSDVHRAPSERMKRFDVNPEDRMNLMNIKTLVITNDGHFVALSPSDTMLALEDDGADFKLPARKISSVKEDKMYVVLNGDKAYEPVSFRTFREIERNDDGIGRDKDRFEKKLSEFLGTTNYKLAFSDISGAVWDSKNITLIPGAKFDGPKEMHDKLSRLAKNHTDTDTIRLLCRNIGIDPDNPVIPLKGELKGYISNKDDIVPGKEKPDFLKHAATGNLYVEKDKFNKYSVRTDGFNKKEFGKQLSKHELGRVLETLGYRAMDIGSIYNSLDRTGKASRPLPLASNINDLYGGKAQKINSVITDMKDKVFSNNKVKQEVKKAGVGIVTGIISEVASNSDLVFGVLEHLSKLANESKMVCSEFEKFAMDLESYDLLNVAQLGLVSHKFSNMIHDALSTNDGYKGVKEACESILGNRDMFEKIAFDLADLADEQFANSNEYISYESIYSALNLFDSTLDTVETMSKIAADETQDKVCTSCGKNPEEPLKDGKCDSCYKEEIEKNKDTMDSTNTKKDDNEPSEKGEEYDPEEGRS